MATQIKIKQSSVPGKIPAAGSLVQGELALNTADQLLYSKDSGGNVFPIGSTGATGTAGEYITTEFTATASQVTFPLQYNTITDYLWIYYNGVLLGSTDYTATNGNDIVLTDPADAGDIITVIRLTDAPNVLDTASTGISHVTHTVTNSAGEDTFAVNYNNAFIFVHVNGILLLKTDYVATNYTSVVLNVPAVLGDEIVITIYYTINITNVVNADDSSAVMPVGTTAERNSSPLNGYLRYNTTIGQLEVYNESTTSWNPLQDGAEYTHPVGDGNLHVPVTGTTNNGKFLKSGATAGSLSWSSVPDEIASQTGNASKFLTTDGSVTLWSDVDSLPNQSGNASKFLITDGAIASWADLSGGSIKRQSFVANANQVTFSITNGFVAGNIDVYLDGVKLHSSDFIDTSGTDIVLAVGASVNQILDIITYGTFSVTNVQISDVNGLQDQLDDLEILALVGL